MDKKALLEQFEQTKTYDLCKSWQIDFDEKAEIYYSINPAYHNDVVALNAAWSMFQEQQAKVEEIEHKAGLRESDHKALLVKYQATKKCWEDISKEKEELQKQVNDLDSRATQYALDEMATAKLNGELQKRVDKAMQILGVGRETGVWKVGEVEQALKGGEA